MGGLGHFFESFGNGNCHKCGSKPVKIINCREPFKGLYCSNEKCENSFDNYMYEINKNRKCYIATAVYGSYDCPQVWILRRYRDNVLANNFLGRIFISLYYNTSPIILKILGEVSWFKKFCQKMLEKLVQKLQKNGFEDTTYYDL